MAASQYQPFVQVDSVNVNYLTPTPSVHMNIEKKERIQIQRLQRDRPEDARRQSGLAVLVKQKHLFQIVPGLNGRRCGS